MIFRFLEAAAHLHAKVPLPTDEEVEDYEFRLRIEAEENGEDLDAEGSDVEEENDPDEEEEAEVRVQAVQAEVPLANRCKVCLDAVANVVTLPCKHMAMCEQCSELLRDDRCPICRTQIVTQFTIFLS